MMTMRGAVTALTVLTVLTPPVVAAHAAEAPAVIIDNAVKFTDDMWSEEALGVAAMEPVFLSKDEQFTLDPAPANDSETTAEDLKVLHEDAATRRTPEEIALIKEEAHEWKKLTLDASVQVSDEERKAIDDFVDRAVYDHGYFSFQQKRLYKRARPTQIDPTLTAVIPVPGHPAYPSGHAGQTHIAALLFSYVDPAHKDFYMGLAHDIGERREIAGLHYPSDSRAGRQLAEQVYAKLMDKPEFRTQIDRMKAAVQNATQ